MVRCVVWLFVATTVAVRRPPSRTRSLPRGGSVAVPTRNEDDTAALPTSEGATLPEEATMTSGRDLEDPLVQAAKRRAVERIEPLCDGLDQRYVSAEAVVNNALAGARDASVDEELEVLLAESAAYMATEHPDYGKLAGRIEVLKLHQTTERSFCATMRLIHEEYAEVKVEEQEQEEQDDEKPTTTYKSGVLHAGFYEKLRGDPAWCERVELAIVHERDFDYDYFGIKTLMRSYLMKTRSCPAMNSTETASLEDKSRVTTTTTRERPQHLLMRVALGVHRGWESEEQLLRSLETYDLMSRKYFIHASPTLFHSGTARPHLSSCFLLGSVSDSIEGIYDTLGRCAAISKAAGGIGLSVSDVRASGSPIRGTGGESNGLVPMLRVFDATARYVDQGGGKRPGAFAAYIEPWHADIFEVLDLKKNHGKEERRARDLFYGLWIPDLFMKRVEEGKEWSLMCPDECQGLTGCYGAEFEQKYVKYEQEGKARKSIDARKLWRAILDAQMETGTPYMLYKDACNEKSNHKHLGVVKCSNLCCEIIEYSDENETAVCNLASIVLPTFVNKQNGTFDFAELKRTARIVARNLDATIDNGAYPSEASERSNSRHRPIGIGVQGLADAMLMLRAPFDSQEARDLNRQIFEAIYYGALEASVELAEIKGPHDSYEGSPVSKGVLQPDMWGVELKDTTELDWSGLRHKIATHGLRNSLLVAPMPTASTAQIVGVNECIEPYTSNLYSRRVKAGEFVVANPHLVRDLAERDLWTAETREDLLRNAGSIQNSETIPADLKALYKTAWELSQKKLLELSAIRGAFVDQSQSHNAFIARPTYETLTAYHFHGWKLGLKTGMYYLRTKPAANAVQVTLDPKTKEPIVGGERPLLPAENAPDVCISCSG